jgi:hypothetical protein
MATFFAGEHHHMIHALLSPVATLALMLGTPNQAAAPPKPGSVQEMEQFNREMEQKAALCPVKAEPAFKDFGFVAPNTLVEMTARIVNTLPQQVKCIASKPTCQCTTVDMAGKVIPAGGSITVPVSMKTSGATGQKLASVHMLFETSTGVMVPGVLEIKMRAEVVYPVRGYQLNPRKDGTRSKDTFVNAYDFPTQTKGEVVVESVDGKPFKVLSVMGQSAIFPDFNPSADAVRTSYRVGYDFSALPCAQIPKYLLIETDRPDAPLIEMRVRHECTKIDAAFGFAQYYENLGVLPQGAPRDFTVEIKHSNGVKIEQITSPDPRLKAEYMGATSDGDSLLVKVRVTPAAGDAAVMSVPLMFSGLSPDPKKPVPPGMVPTGVMPRSGPYLIFYKSVPTAATTPAATPAATTVPQSGASAPPTLP